MMRPSRSCSAPWRSLPGLVSKKSQSRSDIAYGPVMFTVLAAPSLGDNSTIKC